MLANLPLPTTIGVELELNNICGVGADVEKIRSTLQRKGLGDWVVKTDGSCGRTGSGVELNSPIMSTTSHLRSVITVCATLRQLGYKTSSRCGLHVHVGARSLTHEQTRRLIGFMVEWENAFYMLDPDRKTNRFCAPIREETLEKLRRSGAANWNAWSDRYHWLNGMAFNRHGTFELRLMEGTLDDAHVLGWVATLLHIYSLIVNGENPTTNFEKRVDSDTSALFDSFIAALKLGNDERSQQARSWLMDRYSKTAHDAEALRRRAARHNALKSAWTGGKRLNFTIAERPQTVPASSSVSD